MAEASAEPIRPKLTEASAEASVSVVHYKKPKMEPSLPTTTYLKNYVTQNRNSENKMSEDKTPIIKSEVKNENVSLSSMAIGKTPLPSMPPISFEVEDEFL